MSEQLYSQGKTPTQIQHELRELGVKGFVVKVNEIRNKKENKL